MTEPEEIIVQCKCGWQGPQEELMRHFSDRYCPVCGRFFAKYPPADAEIVGSDK